MKEVVGYFIELKTPEAYYLEKQEFTGFWVGQLAPRLGLRGKVDAKSFEMLCENRHPDTGEALTRITRDGRRLAQDHVFGVPKSVSLAYAYTGDERIIQAMRTAGAEAIAALETMVATRVRKNGQDFDRTTGNLVASEHIHLTTRPVDGFPDPHLHVHYVVFNVTWDPVEKQFKAAQMGQAVDNTVYLDKVFLTSLAANLQKIGLRITPTEKAFELEGFDRDLVMRYSRRTTEIESTAARLGITDPIQKAKLGAMTRERKARSLEMPELKKFWFDGLTEEEKAPFKAIAALLRKSQAEEMEAAMEFSAEAALKPAKTGRISQLLGQSAGAKVANRRSESINQRTRPQVTETGDKVVMTEHDRRAVDFAIRHVFERQSVATLNQLRTAAFDNFSVGRATWQGVNQALAEASLLQTTVNGEAVFTTREVMLEERNLIEGCREGKGKHEELNSYWTIEDQKLNEQQQKAVKHVLTSRDWVVGIAGRAGTGKTTLLQEVRRGIERGCHKLIALAPSSEASRDTLRHEGFTNAETVARLLVSPRLQCEARGAVWLVDEAGLLSTRQASKLLALARELDARLILVGDTGQHHSVERGQAFDLLEKFGQMTTAKVDAVQRQKGLYRQFVEHVADKDIDRAFKVLKEMDAVKVMSTDERKKALAKDYINAVERGKTAVVVAPTHEECNEVTQGIRDELKHQGKLKQAVEWDILRDLSWTEAARAHAEHYKKGLVVKFNHHVKGFSLGETVEVLNVRDGAVRVRSTESYHPRIKMLPLGEAENFNVYEKDKLEICEGERLRIRINSKTADGHRVSNGNLYTVDYIDHNGRLVLENGWKLDRNFKHLEHGYTLTSHASQSKSVDCVFVAQTAKYSAHASDLAQFYVSVSRGKSELRIYTDDIELLQEIVSVVRERPMAMEVFNEKEESEKIEQTVERNEPSLWDRFKDIEKIEKVQRTEVTEETVIHAPKPEVPKASLNLGLEREAKAIEKPPIEIEQVPRIVEPPISQVSQQLGQQEELKEALRTEVERLRQKLLELERQRTKWHGMVMGM